MKIPIELSDRIEVDVATGCWNWTGQTNHSRGGVGALAPYAAMQRNKKHVTVHRYLHEQMIGRKLSKSEHAHHKCRNTLCVNPEHIEAIDQSDHNRIHNAFGQINEANMARETCKRGHEWNAESTHVRKDGTRCCRVCVKENMRAWREVRGLTGKHIPKTHCPSGHPYEGDNLRITPLGHRICKECNRLQYWKRVERLAAQAAKGELK